MFLFDSKKESQTVHIINFETNRSYCQIENISHRLKTRSSELPANRRVCLNCADLARRFHGISLEVSRHDPLGLDRQLDWMKNA